MPARVLARPPGAVAVVLLLLALVLAPAVPPPAGAQGAATARNPHPAPNSVVTAGLVRVEAAVTPADGVQVRLDGVDVGELAAGGTVVEVGHGGHVVELLRDGATVRTWQFHAADVQVTAAGSDPLAVALAAGAGGAAPRPVVLANLDRPALALALGPLGVAAGALVLPTGVDAVPPAVLDAAAEAAGPGGEVLLLGGLDAIGSAVAGQLAERGLQPTRVGSGTPSEVAAAAADARPTQTVYRRSGDPVRRPVLVAPAEPLADAVQAAAAAAARGASLVLAGSGPDPLDEATTAVIRSRAVVWLAHSLPDPAAAAARASAAPDARVERRATTPPDAERVWVADVAADPATALLATRAAAGGTAVVVDRTAAARWVGANRPARATTAGPVAPQDVTAWSVDGPDAPTVEAVAQDGTAGAVLRLSADRPVDGADVHVLLAGEEWPGTTAVDGATVTWTPGPRPQLAPEVEAVTPTAVPLVATAVVAGGGHLRHVRTTTEVLVDPLTSTSPEGFVVAGGTSAVVSTGPLRTFTIEVEPATGLDVGAVAAEAQGILLDPAHGWTARGERAMQRVSDPAAASVRVVVATPATVDRFCGRVGLSTGGRLSCWDGRRAMLNLTRWQTGVAPFHTDLAVYRRYLVSHEVGHGLGYGHRGCPAAGALAPVMMQQSKGLGSCVANGWPYP